MKAQAPKENIVQPKKEPEEATSSHDVAFEGKSDSTAQKKSKKRLSYLRALYRYYVYVDVGPNNQRFTRA